MIMMLRFQCKQLQFNPKIITYFYSPIDRPVRQRRRRKTTTVNPEELLDDNALAEEVLRNEYAARIKPEIPEDSLGGKVGKQGTSGVARIRAPKRANAKLVEVKREQIPQTSAPITASQM